MEESTGYIPKLLPRDYQMRFIDAVSEQLYEYLDIFIIDEINEQDFLDSSIIIALHNIKTYFYLLSGYEIPKCEVEHKNYTIEETSQLIYNTVYDYCTVIYDPQEDCPFDELVDIYFAATIQSFLESTFNDETFSFAMMLNAQEFFEPLLIRRLCSYIDQCGYPNISIEELFTADHLSILCESIYLDGFHNQDTIFQFIANRFKYNQEKFSNIEFELMLNNQLN